MSLFVGNVSDRTNNDDLNRMFMKLGSCNVDRRNKYAFVEYKSERHASEAIKKFDGMRLNGFRLNV